MHIRPERVSDYPAIADMYFQAFADVFGPVEFISEVVLTDVYRHAPTYNPELALVAEDEGKILGHILFFPHPMVLSGQQVDCVFLAIVGVLPELQGKGIGAKLIRAGLDRARQMGYGFSIVLGHEKYYPRFGYKIGMYGDCSMQVAKTEITGNPTALSVKPVRKEHVPELKKLWQIWHSETDLTIIPGDSISEWSTHAKHVRSQVFFRDKTLVGYARYNTENPQEPGCLLAKTPEDLQDILAWLVADKESISIPLHPESLVAREWIQGEALIKPWDVAMAMELNPNPAAREYIQEVEEGKRPIGLMLWPALLTAAE